MMPIPTNYPSDVLPAPRVGKSRTETQNYDSRQNFDGEFIYRPVRDFSTVYYEVSFYIPTNKLPLFRLWLNKTKNAEEFDITLRNEGGNNVHTCRWQQVPLNPTERRGLYIYTGVLYSQQVVNDLDNLTPDEADDFYDFVADGGIPYLDIAVNDKWPV